VMRPRFRSPDGWLMLAVASSDNTVYGLFSDGAAQPHYRFDRLGAVPGYITALASFEGDRVFVGAQVSKIYSLDSTSGVATEQSVVLPKTSPSTPMTGGSIPRIVGFDDARMFAILNNATDGSAASQSYILAFDGTAWTNSLSLGLPNEFFFAMVAV